MPITRTADDARHDQDQGVAVTRVPGGHQRRGGRPPAAVRHAARARRAHVVHAARDGGRRGAQAADRHHARPVRLQDQLERPVQSAAQHDPAESTCRLSYGFSIMFCWRRAAALSGPSRPLFTSPSNSRVFDYEKISKKKNLVVCLRETTDIHVEFDVLITTA